MDIYSTNMDSIRNQIYDPSLLRYYVIITRQNLKKSQIHLNLLNSVTKDYKNTESSWDDDVINFCDVIIP